MWEGQILLSEDNWFEGIVKNNDDNIERMIKRNDALPSFLLYYKYKKQLYLKQYKLTQKKLKIVLTLCKPHGIIKFVADEATWIQKRIQKIKKVVDTGGWIVII